MPPVGGFVALCARSGGAPQVQKTTVHADFFKIQFKPESNTFKGKLIIMFSSYRICHKGVKVRLVGSLTGEHISERRINILENCPTENILLPAGELLRQKRMDFSLPLRPDQSYPSPFITSNGCLEYRIDALIKRDGLWETIAWKLVNFKGYCNVMHMEVNPFVESKVTQTKDGEIVSTFRVPNTVAVMGQCDSFEGILELQGAVDGQVNATLTFLRTTIYGKMMHTDVISSQNRHAKVDQKNVVFTWAVVVPVLKRISYSNELNPVYSVRYSLKYEVSMGHAAMNGVAEVTIGTTRDPCGSKKTDDIAIGSSTSHTIGIPLADRRKSVLSLMSMFSLPPAYSQLSSRSGSMMSLETLPPRYDEFKKE